MEKRLGLLLHFSSLTSGVVGLGVGAYHGSRDGRNKRLFQRSLVASFGLMLLIGIHMTDILALVPLQRGF